MGVGFSGFKRFRALVDLVHQITQPSQLQVFYTQIQSRLLSVSVNIIYT